MSEREREPSFFEYAVVIIAVALVWVMSLIGVKIEGK